jgi:hypothetical protein
VWSLTARDLGEARIGAGVRHRVPLRLSDSPTFGEPRLFFRTP